jgi:hypothetical protein
MNVTLLFGDYVVYVGKYHSKYLKYGNLYKFIRAEKVESLIRAESPWYAYIDNSDGVRIFVKLENLITKELFDTIEKNRKEMDPPSEIGKAGIKSIINFQETKIKNLKEQLDKEKAVLNEIRSRGY